MPDERRKQCITVLSSCALEQILAFSTHGRACGFLDLSNVAKCAKVCKDWADCARGDGLWWDLCRRMWKFRKCVPLSIRELCPPIQAYKKTLEDSQRVVMTRQELSESSWNFRVKEVCSHLAE